MRGVIPLLSKQSISAQRIVGPSSTFPFILAARAEKHPLLVVTSSSRSSEDLVNELRELYDNVIEFPAWETLPHERLSPRSDTVALRIKSLYALKEKHTKHPIIVTPVRGVIHRIISELGSTPLLQLQVGQEQSMEELVRHLSSLAYVRTDLVERRGEFAVRGGIVDLFLPLSDYPIRIDFFGDEIEDISYFEVSDQRTIKPVDLSITIFPCRELLLTEDVKNRALKAKSKYMGAEEMLDKISEGIVFEGMESLIPLLIEKTETLLSRVPKGTQIVFIDEQRIASRADDLLATNEEFLNASWSNAALGAVAPINHGLETYISWEELNREIQKSSLTKSELSVFGSDLVEGTEFLDYSAIDPMRGDIERTIDVLRQGLERNQIVIFATHGHGMLERYAGIFRGADLPVNIIGSLVDAPAKATINVTTSIITHGFESQSDQIFFMTERDLTGSKGSVKDSERLPTKRKKAIDPLELRAGDFIVHEQHGIGRYVELMQRSVGGVTREYLIIEYASAKRGQPGDRIFVPTDTLEQVSKYVGGEAPTIHRIGSGEWQKAKSRARKAVRQIAGELIRLYAARTSSPGFAFSPDTPWQRELEDSFSYIETPDQLSTIDEVKADMERAYPTGLSRFNSAKESKEILNALQAGSVDVVIGTHRILSNDVVFKDLGLVVVDEEQRFGVEQKESLKKLRTTVDVLAMSATPIPRTLEMAVTGIREMSTITTPPEERHPILTYVGPAEDAQIAAAIHRELLRDGQIFYLHNRVESIDRTAVRLKELVPEARIRVAHGQMSEGELEDVILAFWNRDFDVLVCTTIVESGLDIQNANTLIVERADRFGLSQLHQIRGRVGRGRERAYAYFLYSAEEPLSELAHERLTTIATNTDLGAGMRVALKDLEIRGAGNLLGGEQSGHIADVGFDLYMRMVGEAVQDYKSGIIETDEKVLECKVELPINAHLSTEYVPGERLRLDLYRRLADVKSAEDVGSIESELIDRFGPLPQEAQALLGVASLRAQAKVLKLTEVIVQGKFLRFSPLVLSESKQLRLARMYPGSIYKSTTNTALVALPKAAVWNPSANTPEIVDTSLLAWVVEALNQLG